MKKVILITGTSRGIGSAIQSHLKALGHIVYGSSRRGDPADPMHLTLDVTDEAACQAAVREVLAGEGRLDVLINNAGFHLTGASEETTLDEIKSQMDLNFYGAIHMIKAVTPVFLQQKSGRIINMSSLGGLLALPFTSAYNASKFALEGYSESLRLELLPLGIYVSNVEPAYINTGTIDQSIGGPRGKHDLFSPYRTAFHEKMTRDSAKGIPVRSVVGLVEKIVDARRPKFRYKLGAMAKTLPALQFLFPQRFFENMVLQSFDLPARVVF